LARTTSDGLRSGLGYDGGMTAPARRSIAQRCNIGPAEIARRRRSAISASILFVLIAAVVVVLDVPPVARLLLWPVATAAAVTWLQVVTRFCVAFGALGLENFGRLGAQVEVDAAERAADRRRALQMIGEGALIGLALTLVVVPLRV
jgi:hypothetical protein